MRGLPADWSQWRQRLAPDEFDRRFQRLAESGQHVHGEADLVAGYQPASVLDAGCGTGRVAIELARRGIRVLGVDADPGMIAAARSKAPELDWRCADLAEPGQLGAVVGTGPDRGFDVVLLAGNVVPYVLPQRRAAAIRGCAGALSEAGRLVAGFTLRPDWPSVDDYDHWCAAVGLVPEDRFATWQGTPYAGGDYLVAVHIRG